MKWSTLTHVGLVRKNNEDNNCICDDIPLLAVADGMGGHKAGEIASRMALESLVAYLREHKEAVKEDPGQALREGFRLANQSVFEQAREDSDNLNGMGTTITAAVPQGDLLYVAHVGDSRAYKVSNDTIKLITTDHSLVNELLRSGGITPEEAEIHPQRNILIRAIGTSPEVQVDVNVEPIAKGDIIILCTDGLSNLVNFEELKEIAGSLEPLSDRVQHMIEKALQRGGNDNITVILYQVD